MKSIFNRFPLFLFFIVSFLAWFLFSNQSSMDILPGHLEYGDWERKEEPERYEGKELFGYIDGGAEIYHQYGFKDLFLSRYTLHYKGKEKEIILEVYEMEYAVDAFGIFSMQRTGDENVSKHIDSLNWVTETQISLVRAQYCINIIGFKCSEKELENFAAFVARRIKGKGELPVQLGLFPSQNLRHGSERYIRGNIAATSESALLGKGFWGLKGKTTAFSARYRPSNSKVIIIDFGKKKVDLTERVRELFEEYLEEVVVDEKVIRGKDATGNSFLFSQEGDKGVLVLGEKSIEFAQLLLREARKNISSDLKSFQK